MKSIRFTALAVLALGMAAAQAGQTLKTTDVRGMKLGMSINETEAALKASDPKANVMKIGNTLSAQSYSKTGGTENIRVIFGTGTGGAVIIRREVSAAPTGYPIAELRQALDEKYGPGVPAGQPPLSAVNGLYARGSDVDTNPASKCLNIAADAGQLRDLAANPGKCTQTLFAWTGREASKGVASAYTVILTDYEAITREVAAGNARAQAQQQVQQQRAQEAAKGVKPSL